MKTDRFVKIMLVIIAGLLVLNCFKDNGSDGISIPFLETEVNASVPAFIQKDKTYICSSDIQPLVSAKVLQIDSNSGWIEINSPSTGNTWVNSNSLSNCRESK